MGPNESKMANGAMYGNNYNDPGANGDKEGRNSGNQGMFAKFMNFGFGTSGN